MQPVEFAAPRRLGDAVQVTPLEIPPPCRASASIRETGAAQNGSAQSLPEPCRRHSTAATQAGPSASRSPRGIPGSPAAMTRAAASRPAVTVGLGKPASQARVGASLGHETIVGDRPSPAVGCRPRGRCPELAGQRGERVGTSEVGFAQRQVVRMHGRAAMRQEAGRLEQRQPGAQSGGDGVRRGALPRPRAARRRPAPGRTGAHARRSTDEGGPVVSARVAEPIHILVHRGSGSRQVLHLMSNPLMHLSRKRQDGSKTPLSFRISGDSARNLR